jgi:hypothetical protein
LGHLGLDISSFDQIGGQVSPSDFTSMVCDFEITRHELRLPESKPQNFGKPLSFHRELPSKY